MGDNYLSAKLLHDLEPFSEMLYQEAEESPGNVRVSDHIREMCPLYGALKQIEQRYGVREPLGQGGMKQVFRVYDALAARHVAMALPLESLPADAYDAFLREAHLTARLEHPCITRLFDMGIDAEGRPFFTMELMKGRSLRSILRALKEGNEREDFPVLKRLSIFLRVCEAIAYAHSRRILHLDIKPENVQVGEYGEVHVCDWGLAVIAPAEGEEGYDSEILLDSDLYCSLSRSVHGTPEYMAPEQRELHQPKTVAMDIYALGCLLQELLTFQSPAHYIHPLSGVDRGLAAVIQRSKSTDPQDRYQNVLELREDILRHIGGYSTSAQKLNFLQECLLFYRRNLISCRIAGGLLAVLALAISLAIHQIDAKRQEADMASARYLAEKLRAEEQLRQQASSAFDASHFLSQPLFMDAKRFPQVIDYSSRQLKRVLQNDPEPDSYAWSQAFWVNFMTQDLASAHAIGLRGNDLSRVTDLVKLAEQFAPRVNSEGYLSPQDLIALWEVMSNEFHANMTYPRYPLIERMLLYDASHPRTVKEREQIHTAVIRLINKDWRNATLKFDADAGNLTLRGEGLHYLRMFEGRYPTELCLLRALDPVALNLRGTDISDLAELNGLRLIRLDIRQTPATDLSPLASMRTLREVIVSPGQFTSAQVSGLPEWIRLREAAD